MAESGFRLASTKPGREIGRATSPEPDSASSGSRAAGACEFLFAGSAILPAFLVWSDLPALAVLAFVVLLLGGAVCGIADPQAPHRQDAPGSRHRP